MAQFMGTVYEVRLIGALLGKPTNNVFHYGVIGGGGSADNVCSAFADDVFTPLANCLSEDWVGSFLNAQAVQGAFDFDDNGITFAGAITAPTEPAFVAWGFRYNRPDTASRHGYKRFAGVADTTWLDGAIDPTFIATLQTLATALGGNIATGGMTYKPLVIRRQEGGEELEVPTYWEVGPCIFQNITTQNTRK